MAKFIDKMFLIWKSLALVGAVCLFADMAFVVLNIILRAFNCPIFGSTEIIRYASLVAAALALAYNQTEDGNIKVTLVTDSLPQKARDILGLIVEFIMVIGFCLIAYYLLRYTVSIRSKGDLTNELHLPAWIFSGILLVGIVTMILANIIKTIDRAYCLYLKKSYDEYNRERYLKSEAANL